MEIDDLKRKYLEKLEKAEGIKEVGIATKQFKEFEEEEKEERAFTTFYETYCDFAHSYLKIKAPKKIKKKLEENIEIANIHVTTDKVFATSIFSFLFIMFAAIPVFILLERNALFFMISVAIAVSYIIYTYPFFLSEITKIKGQEESLLAILYMTIYLRLNPVFESAVRFAADRITGPLQKDLKKILWLVESEEVSSIEKGIELFTPLWVKRNKSFVQSILILKEILTQISKEKQEEVLDKSLRIMLNNTYTDMKHYAQDLKMPVVMLHTFGMMLPLIGLIIFPVINVFMSGNINMSSVFFGYIFVLPITLFFLMSRVLAKRPGAFSFPDISSHPDLPPKGKYKINFSGKTIYVSVLPVAVTTALLIMIPGMIHLFTATLPAMFLKKSVLENTLLQGEYTVKSFLIMLTIPLGMAVGCTIYFLGQSIQRIKIRDKIIEIENEFGDALFQLSNKFSENIPVETAIENFLYEYNVLGVKRRTIYHFFYGIIDDIKTRNMTLNKAVFGKEGMLAKFPSKLIEEIMLVVIESSKKGYLILYNITKKISKYIQNIRKVKELIHDLLNETCASISIHAKFMAPFLGGLVGSLTLMIIKSLYIMAQKIEEIMRAFDLATLATTAQGGKNIMEEFFNFTNMVPPTMFQVMVGIYMVITVILLSYLYNGVKNGFDKTSRNVIIGKNLAIAILVYSIVSFIGVIMLTRLLEASIVVAGGS